MSDDSKNEGLSFLKAYFHATGQKLIVPSCVYDLLPDEAKEFVIENSHIKKDSSNARQ